MNAFVLARKLVWVTLVLGTAMAHGAAPVSIEVFRPNRIYPSKGSCDLGRVDFRNFTYFESEWMRGSDPGPLEDPAHVRKGEYILHETDGFDDLSVEAVAYPDPETAVVSLVHSYGGGSSNQILVAMVFRCAGGKLRNTQLIRGDGHGDGAGVILSDDGKKMIMKSVYDYSNGHCCPRYLEKAVFRFTKRGYVLVTTYQKENRQPH